MNKKEKKQKKQICKAYKRSEYEKSRARMQSIDIYPENTVDFNEKRRELEEKHNVVILFERNILDGILHFCVERTYEGKMVRVTGAFPWDTKDILPYVERAIKELEDRYGR